MGYHSSLPSDIKRKRVEIQLAKATYKARFEAELRRHLAPLNIEMLDLRKARDKGMCANYGVPYTKAPDYDRQRQMYLDMKRRKR